MWCIAQSLTNELMQNENLNYAFVRNDHDTKNLNCISRLIILKFKLNALWWQNWSTVVELWSIWKTWDVISFE